MEQAGEREGEIEHLIDTETSAFRPPVPRRRLCIGRSERLSVLRKKTQVRWMYIPSRG